MLTEIKYNREKVFNYAKKWAYKRNPEYLNFDEYGGDCTNFASQCLLAGSSVMNFIPIMGWYYLNAYNRTPSWTSAEALGQFLLNNKGQGPYAVAVYPNEIQIGDIVQLQDSSGTHYHSFIICGVTRNEIYVAGHSEDRWMYPLSNYKFVNFRFIHITNARKEK
ncbi:MAG: amidase domain-containing protein [Clostridia bacterium]